MADLKISQFVDGGAVQSTDEIATNRAGINTKVFVGSAAALDAGSGVGDVIAWQDDGGGNPIYPAGDGSQITDIDAASVSYTPSIGSFITSSNVQGAIDELADTALQPQMMPSGGMHFDGSSYLNGNPLTGIADGKRGIFYAKVRFENAAGADERIINSAGTMFTVRRHANSNAEVQLRNSGNTPILVHRAVGAFSDAGEYNILASWDLENGLAHLYVNDVSVRGASTLMDDTIDYTVAGYGIGAQANGKTPMTGDIYTLYLNSDEYIDITIEENRRRFYDENGMVAAMGPHGEKVTGNKPILFMGYDTGERFASARGSQTVGRFVVNGTPAAPAVPDVCGLEENAFNYSGIWTPTLTGVTNVSSLTLTQGFYSRNQNKVDCSVRNTVTSASGSDDITNYRISLPISSDITDPQDLIGNMVVVNNSDTPIRPGYIAGGSTNKDAVVTYRSGSASERDINSNFSYISKE